ncbi:substrate-binding domain-containing protein [Dethiobacter alkaliphilus]|uniref:Regulatory protein LysR n=1 Tax=Dethiobacter alkaliphilus AHT 1 TaxID=555088 RepID=C0GJ50_DETAL|nr:substrate-binding domain-containing protein [Dethiobacter alkaliphilus]EEG76683.1 regulatory protein LysR [Dethiobacter alkaliphilus AHT 1]
MGDWEVSLNLGEKIPGKELLLLLEKIDKTGSLNRAVEEAGVSYRYGWGLLNRAEEALGKALVMRQAGGSAGGGTTLTPAGKKLLGHMQALQREVQGQLAALFTHEDEQPERHLVLASTMEPVVTGLLDVLEQAYLQETGITVRHIAAGSGQAMAMAKAGRVDLILTHAPELEEEFVAHGWGVGRIPVMGNDFVLVGPVADPAGTAKAQSAAAAFKSISQAKQIFISRGDQSGTHLAEQKIWRQAGINPAGCAWYTEARNTLGNYGMLQRAAELGGYTLVDRASFTTGYSEEKMAILFAKDPLLENIFCAIPVSRKKAAVNQDGAESFAAWLTSSTAVGIIFDFGRKEYGEPLFTPYKQ